MSYYAEIQLFNPVNHSVMFITYYDQVGQCMLTAETKVLAIDKRNLRTTKVSFTDIGGIIHLLDKDDIIRIADERTVAPKIVKIIKHESQGIIVTNIATVVHYTYMVYFDDETAFIYLATESGAQRLADMAGIKL